MRLKVAILLLGFIGSLAGQSFQPTRERPPAVPREFRGAWSACVYNIDWPSQKGLSASAQQAELLRILNRMQSLKMNALIFQVRPNADAVYRSSLEPWSSWVSGTMGRSPGYDPLDYCIRQAHARGIEVHAWFNPFRALPNKSQQTSRNHVTRTHPSVIRDFKNYRWMDPASSFTRSRALDVMLDVVRRYDIDGLHIDDYFYPYPDVNKNGSPRQIFPDGKSPAQRRAYVNAFVKQMYASVKRVKPWVRVGISPFGIWRPGVPQGVEARIDAYEHLSADSRKWLKNGWCDYLSPQLYWRVEGPQSFHRLLTWWRGQGSRPVWPGLATSRIQSSEDPGRRSGEMMNQLKLTRQIGRNWVGHVHWSVKSVMQNRDGIASQMQRGFYQEPALVPPMPWLSKVVPATPRITVSGERVSWARVQGAGKYAVQARYGRSWKCTHVVSGQVTSVTIPRGASAVAVSAVDRFGTTSLPSVLAKR